MLVSHIGVVNRNTVLKAWHQQDASQLNDFYENARRINDGSYLIVYNPGFNSNFHECFFNFLGGVPSVPITTGITSSCSIFNTLFGSWDFSIFSFFFLNSQINNLTVATFLIYLSKISMRQCHDQSEPRNPVITCDCHILMQPLDDIHTISLSE